MQSQIKHKQLQHQQKTFPLLQRRSKAAPKCQSNLQVKN